MHFKVDIHFNLKSLKINRIIRYLVIADLFFWGGWGLINPIFALFVVGRIPGATVLTVGVASALYWIVKSSFQIPVALWLDRQEGEIVDLKALIVALTLAGFASLVFPLASSIPLLFAVVTLQGLAYGLYTPSWSSLFSRHLDKDHYAFDWSLDSTTIGVASGVAALIGGIFARWLGFDSVFILTGIFSLVSALLLFSVPHLVLPKATPAGPVIPEHSPGTPKN